MQPPPQPRVHLRSPELDVLGGRGGGWGWGSLYFFLNSKKFGFSQAGLGTGNLSACELRHWRGRIPLPLLVGRAP